jgi:5S rRNA maturation endonuclease (ribonuclease M5)
LNIRKKLENLTELLTELQNDNLEIPVIVEGEMDEAALRSLGLRGKIVRLHSGKSILNLCEDLAKEHDLLILLTDWDKRGVRFYKSLKKLITANDMKYNDKYWIKLRNLCSKDIQVIEDLKKYMDNLENNLK